MLAVGEELDSDILLFLVAVLGQYLLPLPLVGVILLFMQKKLVFLRPEQVLYYKEGMSQEHQWRFECIQHVEVFRDNQPQALLRLVLADEKKLPVTRGKGPEFDRLVVKVTAALNVACIEVEWASPKGD